MSDYLSVSMALGLNRRLKRVRIVSLTLGIVLLICGFCYFLSVTHIAIADLTPAECSFLLGAHENKASFMEFNQSSLLFVQGVNGILGRNDLPMEFRSNGQCPPADMAMRLSLGDPKIRTTRWLSALNTMPYREIQFVNWINENEVILHVRDVEEIGGFSIEGFRLKARRCRVVRNVVHAKRVDGVWSYN